MRCYAFRLLEKKEKEKKEKKEKKERKEEKDLHRWGGVEVCTLLVKGRYQAIEISTVDRRRLSVDKVLWDSVVLIGREREREREVSKARRKEFG